MCVCVFHLFRVVSVVIIAVTIAVVLKKNNISYITLMMMLTPEHLSPESESWPTETMFWLCVVC